MHTRRCPRAPSSPSWPVGRVLPPAGSGLPAGGRPSISNRRYRRPLATYPGRWERVTPCPLLVLLQVGFAKPLRSPGALVRSYRTVSPLPDPADPCFAPRSGGLLSVALSAGRPAWALPSTLPCGARTFLNPEPVGAAVAW